MKLSEEQIRSAHRRYMNGELQRDLCKELEVSQKTLKSGYNRLQLPSRKRKNPNCDQLTYNIKDAHNRYVAGEHPEIIAKSIGITKGALVTRFKSRGLFTFPACKRPVVDVPSEHFNPVRTEEAAYWLGFLTADGALIERNAVNRKSFEISVSCSKKDESHMKILANFIGGRIYSYNEKIVNVRSKTSPEWSVLQNYGFGKDKTYRLTWPILSKDLYRHYVRGFFDGDGSAWSRTNGTEGSITIYSVATSFLEQIQRWLEVYDINSAIYIQTTKDHKINGRKVASSKIGRLMIFRIADIGRTFSLLYKDSTIFLSRKRNKLLPIISRIQYRGNPQG